MKAVALYEFQGNPGAEELSFQVGDVLTVTNTSTEDGWWEGITASGQEGIFPEQYVQLLVRGQSVRVRIWKEPLLRRLSSCRTRWQPLPLPWHLSTEVVIA